MPKEEKSMRILVYHSIKKIPKEKDYLRITVPIDLFEKQITYLFSSGYKILPINNILDFISGSREITGREIILTFDDGFDDNFDVASTILRKYGIMATYFLIYNYMGNNEVLFPGCKNGSLYNRPISLNKVAGLISLNMSIGSHSLTHINLADISGDRNRLFEEINLSRKKLEDKFKVSVDYFAYPFGFRNSFNNVTKDIVKKSGYKAAFINVLGPVKKGDDIFELKRTRIGWDDTLFRFKMRLRGAYDWIDNIPVLAKRQMKRHYAEA